MTERRLTLAEAREFLWSRVPHGCTIHCMQSEVRPFPGARPRSVIFVSVCSPGLISMLINPTDRSLADMAWRARNSSWDLRVLAQ